MAARPQRVHDRTGGVDFGARSLLDLDGLEMRWFDRWLSGIDNGVDDEPPVRLFVMGANEWRDEHEWPLAGDRLAARGTSTRAAAAQHAAGRRHALADDARPTSRPTRYVYDPDYPVPTRGGCNCCQPDIVPWGPYDQRDVEMRADVLCLHERRR